MDFLLKLYERKYSQSERQQLIQSKMAMPDGSFPIVDEVDLKNAIKLAGRSKNPEQARLWIINRAKQLHQENSIPNNWDIRTGKKLDESYDYENIKKQIVTFISHSKDGVTPEALESQFHYLSTKEMAKLMSELESGSFVKVQGDYIKLNESKDKSCFYYGGSVFKVENEKYFENETEITKEKFFEFKSSLLNESKNYKAKFKNGVFDFKIGDKVKINNELTNIELVDDYTDKTGDFEKLKYALRVKKIPNSPVTDYYSDDIEFINESLLDDKLEELKNELLKNKDLEDIKSYIESGLIKIKNPLKLKNTLYSKFLDEKDKHYYEKDGFVIDWINDFVLIEDTKNDNLYTTNNSDFSFGTKTLKINESKDIESFFDEKDYKKFIANLQTIDTKIYDFLNNGLRDGESEEDKYYTSREFIFVTDLMPTQSEIDVDKSLKYPLTDLNSIKQVLQPIVSIANKDIVSFDNEFIIDGHHRWSQVYCFNPDAKISSQNLYKNNETPLECLKHVQTAIKIINGSIPTANVNGHNLLKMSESDLKKYVKSTITKDVENYLINEQGYKDIDDICNYIWSNIKQIQKNNQPIKNAPNRNLMPQTDDVKGGVNAVIGKLKDGTNNIKQPFVLNEEQQFNSSISIGEKVSFYPMFKQQQDMGIACEELEGEIVNVKFTKAKVFYDVLGYYHGVIFEKIDSGKVFKRKPVVHLKEENDSQTEFYIHYSLNGGNDIIGKVYKDGTNEIWLEKLLSGTTKNFGSEKYRSSENKESILKLLKLDFPNIIEIDKNELKKYNVLNENFELVGSNGLPFFFNYTSTISSFMNEGYNEDINNYLKGLKNDIGNEIIYNNIISKINNKTFKNKNDKNKLVESITLARETINSRNIDQELIDLIERLNKVDNVNESFVIKQFYKNKFDGYLKRNKSLTSDINESLKISKESLNLFNTIGDNNTKFVVELYEYNEPSDSQQQKEPEKKKEESSNPTTSSKPKSDDYEVRKRKQEVEKSKKEKELTNDKKNSDDEKQRQNLEREKEKLKQEIENSERITKKNLLILKNKFDNYNSNLTRDYKSNCDNLKEQYSNKILEIKDSDAYINATPEQDLTNEKQFQQLKIALDKNLQQLEINYIKKQNDLKLNYTKEKEKVENDLNSKIEKLKSGFNTIKSKVNDFTNTLDNAIDSLLESLKIDKNKANLFENINSYFLWKEQLSELTEELVEEENNEIINAYDYNKVNLLGSWCKVNNVGILKHKMIAENENEVFECINYYFKDSINESRQINYNEVCIDFKENNTPNNLKIRNFNLFESFSNENIKILSILKI